MLNEEEIRQCKEKFNFDFVQHIEKSLLNRRKEINHIKKDDNNQDKLKCAVM